MPSFVPKVRLQWANAVRHDPHFRPSEHSVAAEIANHANINGNAWPGKRRLAEKLGLSERTIQRAVAKLVKYGYLKRIIRLGRSNLYQLCFPGARQHVDNLVGGRPPSEVSVNCSVAEPGHASPPRGGTNGQETFTEPNFRTYPASPVSLHSSCKELRKGPKGLEGKKGSSASQVYASGQTRTELELELARRLGEGGSDILVLLPPFLVELSLRRLAAGVFGDEDIRRVLELVRGLHREGQK